MKLFNVDANILLPFRFIAISIGNYGWCGGDSIRKYDKALGRMKNCDIGKNGNRIYHLTENCFL